jgi:uncharacterized protein (UPF0297 family)
MKQKNITSALLENKEYTGSKVEYIIHKPNHTASSEELQQVLNALANRGYKLHTFINGLMVFERPQVLTK